jgi:hypothetical protein
MMVEAGVEARIGSIVTAEGWNTSVAIVPSSSRMLQNIILKIMWYCTGVRRK